MFLLIGLLFGSLSCDCYAGEPASKSNLVEPVHWRNKAVVPRNAQFYPHLSVKSVDLLKRIKSEISSELAAVCIDGLGDLKRCNDLMSGFSNEYMFDVEINCKIILGSNPYNDRFDINTACKEELVPTFKAWKQEWQDTHKDQIIPTQLLKNNQ